MSSGLGSVANNENGGWEVCWASKAALNIMMRSFAARHAGEERSFVVIAPGWLLTDMGSSQRPFVSRTASPASSTPSRAKPERLVFGFWAIGVRIRAECAALQDARCESRPLRRPNWASTQALKAHGSTLVPTRVSPRRVGLDQVGPAPPPPPPDREGETVIDVRGTTS
jgi:NAD(P)-dependent dehydrogenase (short-subunit alcohol dehydrogenase family)